MTSLTLTIREAVRYRGRSGQYSWIAHRLSGLAILGFVVIHVWDTANAFFAPHIYAWSLALFKHPLFALGEIAIMAVANRKLNWMGRHLASQQQSVTVNASQGRTATRPMSSSMGEQFCAPNRTPVLPAAFARRRSSAERTGMIRSP